MADFYAALQRQNDAAPLAQFATALYSHGRFRESDLFRKLADAYRRRGVAKAEDLDPPTSSRAVAEYLSVPDDAALGGRRQPSRSRSRRPIRRPVTPPRPTRPPSTPTPTTTSSI